METGDQGGTTVTSLLLKGGGHRRKECPGCQVDRIKEQEKGIPYRNLSYIWTVSLSAGEFVGVVVLFSS